MKIWNSNLRLILGASLALTALPACDDDSDGDGGGGAGGESGGAGGEIGGAGGEVGGTGGEIGGAGGGEQSLFGFAIRVRNPEGRNIYLGAYDGVPSGELSRDKMVELANNDVDFNDGYAYDFSRETGTYTRYSVNAELEMVAGPQLSLSNLGLNGARGTFFISNTRAYNYGTSGATPVVAVFDPTEMTITGTIPADVLVNDDFPLGIVGKPAHFGDYVAFGVDWMDRANLRTYDKAAVGLVRDDTEDEPVMLVEDDRCAGVYETFVDDQGDLYAMGTASGGYFGLYGQEPAALPPACALRIKAGEAAFDPDFYVDLEAATGTEAVYGAWHIGGHKMLVLGLAGDTVPEAADYLSQAIFDPYLLDLDTGEATPMEGLPSAGGKSYREHHYQGTLYYQVYTEVDGVAAVDVYAVPLDGTPYKAFSTIGDPWSVGELRIR